MKVKEEGAGGRKEKILPKKKKTPGSESSDTQHVGIDKSEEILNQRKSHLHQACCSNRISRTNWTTD